jgi:hypothetical protein
VSKNLLSYIINFLLPDNQHLAAEIGYTNSPDEFENFRVIICPSRFFDKDFYGTKNSLPKLPLQTLEGTEILFGTPEVEQRGGKIFVNADIIASSFFLLARYEEWLCGDAVLDSFGRFEGKKSLQYRAGFINRPIVDEYAILLRKWLKMAGLQVNEPKRELSKIYLTHDIDIFTYYRNVRIILSKLKQSICHCRLNPQSHHSIFKRLRVKSATTVVKNIFRSLFNLKNDEAYTFDWLVAQDLKVQDAEKIFFIKACTNAKGIDFPEYNLKSKNFQNLLKFFAENGCKIGLHASCQSFEQPFLVENEQKRLSAAAEQKITLNRCHYLRILPPNQPQPYIAAGITDDFSVSFADVAGFRLGTSRAVRWLNPQTLEIEPVTLHSLLIMECTLGEKRYMNLNFDEAFSVSKNLIEQAKKHNGEVSLLWHNTSVIEGENDYYRELYEKTVLELRTKS